MIILSDDKNVEVSESHRHNSECYTSSNSQMLTDLIIASSMVPVRGKKLVPSGDEGDESPKVESKGKMIQMEKVSIGQAQSHRH